MNINKVILGGRLTRDPETKTVGSTTVTEFSIDNDQTWKNKAGEKQKKTAFVECAFWGKGGEVVAKYFGKGSRILVVGQLDQESWEDKATGQKRSKMKVRVDSFEFVDSNKDRAAAPAAPAGDDNNPNPTDDRDHGAGGTPSDEDTPFG